MEDSLVKNIKISFKQLFVGEAVLTIVGFLASYFYAKFLGPEIYGTWQTAHIFTQYSLLFAFGLPFIMRRDFIQLRSEGKIQDAINMANQVFSYSLITGPVFSIILFSIAFFVVSDQNFSYALIAVGLINMFQVISSYGDIMSKGFNNYKTIRNSKILISLITLFSILLVWKYSFNGLLIGLIISQFANAIYYYLYKPLPFKWHWNFSLLRRMIFVGFPIYLQNIVEVIFSSIDRLIIAAFLSFTEVGHYSLSALIRVPITLMVSSLGIVVFTQLNQKYGKSTSPKVVRMHMEVPQLFVSYIMSPLIVIGMIILPYLVQWFLPKYVPGIEAAQVFVFAVLFLTLAGFSSNALFILNKQKYAALSFTLSGVIKIIGSLLFLKMGYGITAIASITLFSYFFYDLLMIYWVKKSLCEAFSLKLIIQKNIPILFSISFFFLIRFIFHNISFSDQINEILLKLAFIILFLIVYIFFAKRKIDNIFKFSK